MPEYKKYPYRSEFPDSTERAGRHQNLEELRHVRWTFYWVRRTDDRYGRQGDYIYDTETAVITNRNTGYRWIMRRGDHRVEFQTNGMFEEQVGEETIDVHLTIEEAEALALTAKATELKDKRVQALADQAIDQIAVLCRQVRERVRLGDQFVDSSTSSIPRREPEPATPDGQANEEEPEELPRPKFRPLGDPDNLSLKEAGEIVGKARNTVYGWYRSGKFPPAVDVGPYIRGASKPVIVVPRYRLEAWQAGERMPEIFPSVFDTHGLNEKPWACLRPRKEARREDIDFWVARRGLVRAKTKDGRVLYGVDLDPEETYEPRDL